MYIYTYVLYRCNVTVNIYYIHVYRYTLYLCNCKARRPVEWHSIHWGSTCSVVLGPARIGCNIGLCFCGMNRGRAGCPLNATGPLGGASPVHTSQLFGPVALMGLKVQPTCFDHSSNIPELHPYGKGSSLYSLASFHWDG